MKKLLSRLLLIGGLCFFGPLSYSQQYTQTIRGRVIDKDTNTPLIGATITVQQLDQLKGTVTDFDGHFKLVEVPVGRRDIVISYLGYEPVVLSSIMLTSGKELVLNIDMVESAVSMQEVVVSAELDKAETINEMATVSARSFSVEETGRYAGSYFDPARMAQNYAGVAVGSGDDLANDIIVRGNSPMGVLWRLEGIEIPNPNHFGAMGNSGGGISMLSSSILSNSDFYTGAFPAEFGNAQSSVFDLNMRNGNNEKREFSLMLGVLGMEGSMEGPFSKNSKASYLINARYATLAALGELGLNPVGDVLPAYRDISFKFNIPTPHWGTFSLWGLGGSNRAYEEPVADQSTWQFEDDRWGFNERQKVGTVGLSHRILLSDRSYLKTVVAASSNTQTEDEYWLDETKDYAQHLDEETRVSNNTYRISSTYNHKFNAKNTFRGGIILSHLEFDFIYDEDEGEGLTRLFDNEGDMQFLQAFAHWKHRFNPDWTLNAGLHYSQLLLNNNYSIEPRAALSWQVNPRQRWSFAAGLHSRMEHPAAYLFDGTLPNGRVHTPATHLELSKSLHTVLGYDYRMADNLRLKAEFYYQYLYDVPIENDPNSIGSLLNAIDIWDLIGVQDVVNEGTGVNYGLDLTLEKFFSDSYYFLATGSLYDSQYTPANGESYNTAFNGNYQLNLLGGKEFKVGSKRNNIFGLNGKFILAGGRRQFPIDLAASQEAGYTVYVQDQPFGARVGSYYRFDLGLSYRINAKKVTHTIMLDIQNVTNRLNVFNSYYSAGAQGIVSNYQTGLFPVFNYRVEF